jgi:hypothetical protein
MPTATDLVTDLPADFEVFGQAVDTSLADLLGGTTGQVLKKTPVLTWILCGQRMQAVVARFLQVVHAVTTASTNIATTCINIYNLNRINYTNVQ